MQLNPYLSFNGDCEEAFKFYERLLGAKIEGMSAHAGPQVPPDWRDKIRFAYMRVGATELMASDALPGHYEEPKGFWVSVRIKGVAEGERIFKALAEQGTVQMRFQPTFWSPGFGMCVDRFGIPWMVSCEREV